MAIFTVIVAAGCGNRFGNADPKQYFQLAGYPILFWTVKSLINSKFIGKIVLITHPSHSYDLSCLHTLGVDIDIVACGGATRLQTVINACSYVEHKFQPQYNDIIMIHDGVRCCIDHKSVDLLVNEYDAKLYSGAILATAITDSVKLVHQGDKLAIKQNIERDNLYLAQTPQLFLFSSLKTALISRDNSQQYTDEASLCNEYDVQAITNPYPNPKLTYQQDIPFVRYLLKIEN